MLCNLREKRVAGNNTSKKQGFTLAETLMTVAILTILLSVAFIGVVNYLRLMAQVERDGIAKELFVSAQNHLTMAESQGYLGRTEFGIPEDSKKNDVFYIVVNSPEAFSDDESVLSLMLPFGSVDETIRVGGSYIIRYQREPALVLDVFYCPVSGKRFLHTLTEGDYTLAMEKRGAENKIERRKFGADKAVLGWFGGEEAQKLVKGEKLETPVLEIINGEKLLAIVKDPNPETSKKAQIRLIITGETSKKQAALTLTLGTATQDNNIDYDNLTSTYTVTLDAVTTPGHHFSELFGGDGLIPGENLTVQAVAFSNEVLTNIAYSDIKKTNSLYEDLADSNSGQTALINNIRHLENLDPEVSGVNGNRETITINAAQQTSDLDWNDFRKKIMDLDGSTKVSVYKLDTTGTIADCYLPVNPSEDLALDYDGGLHRITGIKTDYDGNAGVFGMLPGGSKVKDLMLVNFSITSTGGDAGTLAGAVQGSTSVTNVLAREADLAGEADSAVKATGSSSSAGGLVGSAEGGSFLACGAAVKVSSSGADAGGLIGTVSGSLSVNQCYAGGHTEEGKYNPESGYNVTSSAGRNAGGLIGNAGDTQITDSYSTCSVSGGTAGGLLGSGGSGSSVTNSYATGLVKGGSQASEGAFAGAFSGEASNCHYLESINEEITENSGAVYMPAVGGSTETFGITAIDADTDSYDRFVGVPDDWESASPYDTTLIEFYQGKYNLKTVAQLAGQSSEGSPRFAYIHYGDWPSPEIMVVNKMNE